MHGAGKIAIGAAGALLLYLRYVRPWTMRWGATDEEAARVLPGDALEPDAGFCATHAITIGAPPAHVWPWLVQMGSGRAGWYAFDRLDNGGTRSAVVIHPELQRPQIGDVVPMRVGKEVGPRVAEIQRGRRTLWRDPDQGFTWEWILTPTGDDETRLLSRVREAYPPILSPRIFSAIAASTGDVFMAHRQLKGIKRRAERRFAASRPSRNGWNDEGDHVRRRTDGDRRRHRCGVRR